MKLNVGERLEGAGPAHQPGGYVVTSVVRETPWFGLYLGKKIFYNFDFTAKRVRETDDVEWLDVFLRTIRYPVLDDPAYVQQRRALARAEARAILGNRKSNLWPEPLDLLEIENLRDPFTFADAPARAGEPVLVFTRPHGRFTTDWQQQILPISSILSVLAELLEFLQQAHDEGLLLLGLGPASLLIDASDRVHYIGTEMVLSQQSAFLKDTTHPEVWQRHFPADRFARGYAAPECFDPVQRPDVRSDLYAWGSLAYSLITGTELSKVAQEQGRPWATFVEGHWSQLEKVLSQLPRNSLHGWAEQIGVNPDALLEAWPVKFLSVLRMLLSPDPARRPRTVKELLAWMVDPPPSPVAGFMALHTDADTARLLLDCTGVDAGLEFIIQNERKQPAQQPSDGVTVAQGPLRPQITIHSLPVTLEPLYYTVFTRRQQGERFIYSPGVSALLWHIDASSLRRWVEREAAVAFSPEPPLRVSMVLGVLDVRMVVDSLLTSLVPRVRAWGLRRVEQSLRTQGHSDSLEVLLWSFLRAPQAELRQSAAAILWTYHPSKGDEVLLRLVEALEKPPLDASISLAPFLRQLQLPEERIRRIIQQLEAKRPSQCPLCKKPFTHSELALHLQTEHGFLLFEGDLLPAERVHAQLWQRVFHQQDSQAHDELMRMYLKASQEQQTAALQHYLRDLQHFLLGGTRLDAEAKEVPVALPFSGVLAYQNMLRQHPLFIPITQQLLRSSQGRLRELGCQTVLPHLQEQLHGRSSVAELRRLLAVFSPDLEQTDLQMDLCRQLSQLDVDQALVRVCITQLEEERLVHCSECGSEVQAKNLEFHLRRAHQIFQFRGARGTYPEVRAAMLKAVCTPPPDVAAWHGLQSLVEDKHGKDVDRYLVAWLYQSIKDVDADQRNASIVALADLLVMADAARRLLPIFAGPSKNTAWESLGQRIALEISGRLPPPLPLEWIALVAPFLDLKELPRRSRENTVLALLRSVDKSSPAAFEVLRAYVSQSGKRRGLEKLQQLEQRLGQTPALNALCQEFEGEIRMSCPRCPTELRKKEMVGHLWDKHHLYLDGQRVREPWRVIEDWVVDYGLEKDPQVLQRCRELALRHDPGMGLARLQRLLYQRGLRDRELFNELRTQVRSRKATLCPNCCALVPVEEPPAVQPIKFEAAHLKGYGYQLEVSENGLVPSLVVESPDAVVYRGREPGRGLTRVGGVLLLCGPLIAVTYSALDWYTNKEYPAAVVWSVAIGCGLFTAGLLYLVWPNPRPTRERLIRGAWKVLVPEMLEEKMNRRSWGFLHGLAEASAQVPAAAMNRELILECCEQASEAAGKDPLARACLSTLSRSYLAQLCARHEEPFEFILTLSGECFEGKLPLSFLSDLLEIFHGPERSSWSRSDQHRLPILLAARAFEAEVDLDDWLSLGRAFPVLNAVLNLEQRWHWLQVHAFWTLCQERPWDALGEAVTLFEIAEAPADYEELLAYYPDVLLYTEKSNLLLSTRGVWYEGVCMTSFTPHTEITVQRHSSGYELQVGYFHVRCSENPGSYLDDLREWLNYYFQTFVPGVPSTTRPMTEGRHRMWQRSKVICPECQRPLVPCLGDLGLTVR